MNEFKECAKCAAEPGSPPLCRSCLHNRGVISDLNERVQKYQKTLSVFEELIELLK